jgi:actin-like protein 6A
MSTLLGGDEVSALVVDVGSSVTRMGYAGEDGPKAVFPSAVGVLHAPSAATRERDVGRSLSAIGEGMDIEPKASSSTSSSASASSRYFVGTTALAYRRDFMELQSPLTEGLVSDWELYERLLDHGFQKALGVDTKHHPVLLAEPSYNTRQLRERATELLFEKYQVPALFTAKNAVLSAFSSGRSTGLVLDSGGGVTTAVPVHDGYALTKCISRSGIAGDTLTKELFKYLEKKGTTVRPQYCIERKVLPSGGFQISELDFPNITQSYHNYMALEVVRDIKESILRISEISFDEEAHANIPAVQYELPDGKVLDVGPERFSIPEILFDPNRPLAWSPTDAPRRGVHQMVFDAISASDADIRKDLFSNIILTGGNSLLPGFVDRLHRELTDMAPQRFKIIATNFPSERKFGVWIGGSILGSLATLQQIWISKSEFEEHGPSIVERKCP